MRLFGVLDGKAAVAAASAVLLQPNIQHVKTNEAETAKHHADCMPVVGPDRFGNPITVHVLHKEVSDDHGGHSETKHGSGEERMMLPAPMDDGHRTQDPGCANENNVEQFVIDEREPGNREQTEGKPGQQTVDGTDRACAHAHLIEIDTLQEPHHLQYTLWGYDVHYRRRVPLGSRDFTGADREARHSLALERLTCLTNERALACD